MPPPTDTELITQAQDNGREIATQAYAVLVQRYSPALLRYLGNLLPCRDLAEDVAQEVFLAVWSQRERFDPGRGSFAAWLFTIARNRAHNLRRQMSRTSPGVVLEQAQAPTMHRPGPDRHLVIKEAFAALDRALAQLPFDQRSVFILAEIQGLTMAEIAAIENLPTGTVKSRLARARRKLRGRLKKMGELLDA